MSIKIYTDGSSRGNPGPGGYGIVMVAGNYRKEFSRGFRLTTNNRMELMAVIEAMKLLKRNDLTVDLYTDSKYVCEAIEKKWVFGWQQKGFKNKANPDLWREFFNLVSQIQYKISLGEGPQRAPRKRAM